METTLYRVAAAAAVMLGTALLPACKSVEVPKLPGITPYRMVIMQGNSIFQEMVAQLKPGMTKEQVRFVLGTPLVMDIFHADRWDYVFFREAANGKREQRNLSVVFENSKLARVLGDLMPSDGAVQAGGFDLQTKPEAPKPAAKPEPKPEAKPAAEPDKPVQPAQNWGTTNYETKAEAASVPRPEEKSALEEKAAGEEKKEPGFLERLRQKIGL